MEILNPNSFDIKKKNGSLILTSKNEKEPFVITFVPAGWTINTDGWEALYAGNDCITFSAKGISMKNYRWALPVELRFKLKKKDNLIDSAFELLTLMNDFKLSSLKELQRLNSN